jgi:O-antigen ligase
MSWFMLFQMLNTISRAGIASTFIGIAFLISLLYIHEKKERNKIVLFSSLTSVLTIIYFLSKYEMNLLFIRFAQILSRLGIEQVNDYLDAFGFSSFIAGSSNIDPHFISIEESLKAFVENPLLGKGYTFSEQYLWEHNRYLFILTSSGLLTLVPYILFLIGLTILVRKTMLNIRSYKTFGINYIYLFYACNIMFLFKLLNEGMETFFYWILFALGSAWVHNLSKEIMHA